MNFQKSKQPLLSAIVLTFNRREKLSVCLKSLFAQAQGDFTYEIIVVIDGSSDGTREMLEELTQTQPSLKYIYQSNQGIPAAKNTGIRAAEGELISCVADDFIVPPDFFISVVRFFKDYPNCQLMRGKIIAGGNSLIARAAHLFYDVSIRNRLSVFQDPRGYGRQRTFGFFFRKLPPIKAEVTTRHDLEAGSIFRKELVKKIGFFNEALRRGEDTEFSKRARQQGIEVYYNPFLEIKNQYSPKLKDILNQCVESGRFRYHLQTSGKTVSIIVLRDFIMNLVLRPIWRARQADSVGEAILYLPIIFLMHLADMAGFYRAKHEAQKVRSS